MRVRWPGSRPIGASMRPTAALTEPITSARYVFLTRRALSCAWSEACAASVRATMSSPLVSRSSRWTMPGRWTPAMLPGASSPPRPSNAFTSVPLSCPAEGCTTWPAGLSTISRSSSSWTTDSGRSGSPRGVAGAGGGIRSSGSVPVSTIVFAFTATPPAVKRPSPIRRWTWLRDRPLRSVAQRSARAGAASGGISIRRASSTAFGAEPPSDRREQACGEEEDAGTADRGVGEVEGVPADAADACIDEVHHVAQPDPIQEVAERPAEQQAQRDRQVRIPARPRVVADDQAHDDQRHERERQRLTLEEAEEAARVLAVDEAQQVVEDPHELAGRQERGQPGLGELVRGEDQRSEPQEPRPHRRAVGLALCVSGRGAGRRRAGSCR